MERSKIRLCKWVLASHLMAASKKGISAKQIQRMLGLTYKSAWFVMMRLREAMQDDVDAGPIGGEGKTVESDETFVGGKAKNVHKSKGTPKKEAVHALVERGGQVRVSHVPDVTAKTLRKAIGKKIHSLMASLKTKFLEGCAASGTPVGVAQQLWSDMEQAQDYSFNKSHAACYALIAYRTAWLRANHPCEYMAALISSVMNTKDRVPFYVNACHELGIEVLPPDVNTSQVDFAVVEGKIRFGLNAVNGVGESASAAIIRARDEGGPFTSIFDFTERVDRPLVRLVHRADQRPLGPPLRGLVEPAGGLEVLDLLFEGGELLVLGGDVARLAAPRTGTALPSPRAGGALPAGGSRTLRPGECR